VTAIPHDYAERVYAGILGKLIGVYLGRPFEGWTYERIMKELGPINYYVNERRDVALRSHHLVVTDARFAARPPLCRHRQRLFQSVCPSRSGRLG
jgi:hypothetical protein